MRRVAETILHSTNRKVGKPYNATNAWHVFDYPLLRKECPQGVNDGTVGYVLIGMQSIQTAVVSGTVWPQFAMHGFDYAWWAPVWGLGVVVGGGDGSSEVVTYYRLPIVTIGLSLIVFAVIRLVTDGRRDGSSKRRRYTVKCTVHRPPKPRSYKLYSCRRHRRFSEKKTKWNTRRIQV